ncbi:unnamed protein product [marine sediment metagenome]|uniref:Uncharacterized protein n=1 Tax=marine sediment metagenome TaxID=412755 RepID=X1B7U3_9ZZZZ
MVLATDVERRQSLFVHRDFIIPDSTYEDDITDLSIQALSDTHRALLFEMRGFPWLELRFFAANADESGAAFFLASVYGWIQSVVMGCPPAKTG